MIPPEEIKLVPDKSQRVVTVRMPAGLHSRLRAICRAVSVWTKSDVSMNKFCLEAIEKAVTEQENAATQV